MTYYRISAYDKDIDSFVNMHFQNKELAKKLFKGMKVPAALFYVKPGYKDGDEEVKEQRDIIDYNDYDHELLEDYLNMETEGLLRLWYFYNQEWHEIMLHASQAHAKFEAAEVKGIPCALTMNGERIRTAHLDKLSK